MGTRPSRGAPRATSAVVALVAIGGTGLALIAAPAAAVAPCAGSDRPWCDPKLADERRAELVVAELTLEEKFSLMGGDDVAGVFTGQPANGTSQGIERVGIPTLYFNDGPAGLRKGRSTGLPAPIALASTFDPQLAQRFGAVIGEESFRKGIHVSHSPAVNIARTPLGGRTFEYFGEDPLVAARTAVAFTEGVQAEGVIANVKHYAANNQETDRFVTNAVVDPRTLREIYLPAFEATVRRGDVGSVMLAYNRVNGRKMTEHAGLVNGFLRGELGFGGFTLTDYGLAQMSTAASANAGTDLEMPQAGWYSRPALQQAVATGQVSERTIDEAVSRILGQMFRFGIFDRDRPAPDSDASLPVERHARVARRVAERGLVLLKNEADLLPLDRERIGSIAVLGVKSDAYQRGGGSSSVEPAYSVTPLQGIRNLAGPGVEVTHDDSGSPQAASELAAAADVAVVIANDNMTEFADKPCLSLRCGDPGSGDQDGLIAAVADANPRTIVVLETGSPVTMPWANPVPAILAAWYPGQEGGNAIARVLFGRTDPGGRLPITFPASESDTPTADPARYPGIALEARYDEGVLVGYRHYDENGVEPLFPFGHGLSYARSRYSGLGLEPRRGGSVRVSFRVRNRGSRRGTDVPQVYVGIPEAPGVEQPPRWLRGFERIGLRPGKSKRVTIRLPRRAFSQWDADAGRWRVARGCHRIEVGASSRDLRLRGRIARGGGRC